MTGTTACQVFCFWRAEDLPGAEPSGQRIDHTDPVLDRHYASFGAKHRPQDLGGTRHIPELDAEKNEIAGADRFRVLHDIGAWQMHIAERRMDRQALGFHRLLVGAAGDKGDLVPRLGQARAEITADRPGPDDRDFQPNPSSALSASAARGRFIHRFMPRLTTEL